MSKMNWLVHDLKKSDDDAVNQIALAAFQQ